MTRLPLTLLLALGLASTTPAQDLRLVLPIGHTDAISSAQFSPNGIVVEGKYEVMGDGTLRVTCEFFNATGFLGEAQWTEAVEADWPALILDWILAQAQD